MNASSIHSDLQNSNVSALITCMPHLLHHYELPNGKFIFTLPFLQIVQTILRYIQRWSIPTDKTIIQSQQQFAQYLEYIRLHILVSFNSWRYSTLSERWQIGLLLMDILQLILTDVSPEQNAPAPGPPLITSGNNVSSSSLFSYEYPSDSLMTESDGMEVDNAGNISVPASQSIKYSLLQWLLYDSSFHNVILNIISSGSETLTHLRVSLPQSEVQTIEELILHAFDVLERVLLERDGISRGESSLEHSLMSYSPGREHSNFILVISSFILYRYNSKLPLIATRILRSLCQLSLLSEFSQRRPSLVAYLGSEGSLICSQLMQLLKGNRERNEELHIEILQLVSTTLEYQLGMAEILLLLDKDPNNSKDNLTPSTPSSKLPQQKRCGPVSSVLSILSSEGYPTKQPKLYAAALSLLHSVWECTPDHAVVQTLLRNNEKFWKYLIEPLRVIAKQNPPEPMSSERKSFLIAMSGWALRIISLELYYDTEAIQRLEKFVKLSDFVQKNLSALCSNFSTKLFDPDPLTEFNKICTTYDINSNLFCRALSRQTFGPASLYNIELVRRKFGQTDISPPPNQLCKEFVELTEKVNENMALLDAQLGSFTAFQLFVQLITARDSVSKVLCKIELFSPLITQLAKAMSEKQYDLPATRSHLLHLSDLLIQLIHQYNRRNDENQSVTSSLSSNIHLDVISTIEILSQSISLVLSSACHSQDGKLDNLQIPQHEMLSNLFFSVLLLLPHEQNNPKMQKVLLNLIPSVCIGSACADVKGTCFLVLSVIVRNFNNTETLVAYLHKYQMFSSIINSFINAAGSQVHSIADASMQLLLSLASRPYTALELMKNKLIFVFCDTSQRFFHHNLHEAYINQQRNPNHQIWCQIIRTTTQMSFSLQENEEFHQLLPRFIIIHQERLLDKWQMFAIQNSKGYSPSSSTDESMKLSETSTNLKSSSSGEKKPDRNNRSPKVSPPSGVSFSIGILEEIECVTALYDRWIHSLTNWKLSFNPRTIKITIHLRYLLQYFILSLLRPSALWVNATPITEQEQKSSNGAGSLKPKRSASITFRSSLSEVSISGEGEMSKFQKDVVNLMHRSISNCLSFLRHISPKLWSYYFDPSNIFILFSPALEPSSPDAPPCLGVLVSYSGLCLRLLEKETDSSCSKILEFNIYNSLAVLLLQISVYPCKTGEIDFAPNQLKSNLERLCTLCQKLPDNSLEEFVNYTMENVDRMTQT